MGCPGLQLDYIFDALYDRQKEVRVMRTRHEQAAAYMAFGYAQRARRIIYGLYNKNGDAPATAARESARIAARIF